MSESLLCALRPTGLWSSSSSRLTVCCSRSWSSADPVQIFPFWPSFCRYHAAWIVYPHPPRGRNRRCCGRPLGCSVPLLERCTELIETFGAHLASVSGTHLSLCRVDGMLVVATVEWLAQRTIEQLGYQAVTELSKGTTEMGNAHYTVDRPRPFTLESDTVCSTPRTHPFLSTSCPPTGPVSAKRLTTCGFWGPVGEFGSSDLQYGHLTLIYCCC